MKRIEKLAREYTEGTDTNSHYTVDGYIAGYRQGFQDALEVVRD